MALDATRPHGSRQGQFENVVLADMREAREVIGRGERSMRAIAERVLAVAVQIRQDAATCRADGEEDEAVILETYARRIEEALR